LFVVLRFVLLSVLALRRWWWGGRRGWKKENDFGERERRRFK